jgi:hypothetical protein
MFRCRIGTIRARRRLGCQGRQAGFVGFTNADCQAGRTRLLCHWTSRCSRNPLAAGRELAAISASGSASVQSTSRVRTAFFPRLDSASLSTRSNAPRQPRAGREPASTPCNVSRRNARTHKSIIRKCSTSRRSSWSTLSARYNLQESSEIGSATRRRCPANSYSAANFSTTRGFTPGMSRTNSMVVVEPPTWKGTTPANAVIWRESGSCALRPSSLAMRNTSSRPPWKSMSLLVNGRHCSTPCSSAAQRDA